MARGERVRILRDTLERLRTADPKAGAKPVILVEVTGDVGSGGVTRQGAPPALDAARAGASFEQRAAAYFAWVGAEQRARAKASDVVTALRAWKNVAWAGSLTDLAVSIGLEAVSPDIAASISRAVREEIDFSLASGPRAAASRDEGSAEDTLATLAVEISDRVSARLPAASSGFGQQMLFFILATLVAVGVAMWQAESGSRDHAEAIRTLEQIRDAVRELGQPDAHPEREERLVAVTDRSLRSNPESTARKVGTVAAGETVTVRMRSDRWLYVTVDGASDPREGWTYLRDLRPVQP